MSNEKRGKRRRRRGKATLSDWLGHFLVSCPRNQWERDVAEQILRILAGRLDGTEDPTQVHLRSEEVLRKALDDELGRKLKSGNIKEETTQILWVVFRKLVACAQEVLQRDGLEDLRDLPVLDLSTISVVGKVRASTLGEWMDAYRASGDCPASVLPNLPGVFRRFAELVAGVSDPYAVSLWGAGGLSKVWEQDVRRRQEAGELTEDSGVRYLSWARRAIAWAVDHLVGRDAHVGPDILVELGLRQHRMLAYLRDHHPKAEAQKVRLFFQLLDEGGIPLEDLEESGEEMSRRFYEALKTGGSRTYEQVYSTALRGLRHLMDAGLLPIFPFFRMTQLLDDYGLRWQDIPSVELHQRATRYFEVACEEEAFEERPGRVVAPATRDARLAMLGRYIGFLEQVAQHRTETLSIDQIFGREHLKAYAAFLQERKAGRVTGGIQGTIDILRQMAVLVLGVPRKRFLNLVDPKKVEHRSKVGRVPDLDELHDLMDYIGRTAREPGFARTSWARLSALQLHGMLSVLADCPLRAEVLCGMRLGDNLFQDPVSRVWRVKFSSDEMKGDREFSYPLSEALKPTLESYLNDVRPQILEEKTSSYAFPTHSGRPVAATYFSRELARWDRRRRDVGPDEAITPHRIRDAVSLACVRFLPQKGSQVATAILHHVGLRTLEKHYLDEVGRSSTRSDQAMWRLVKKDRITSEDVVKLVRQIRRSPGSWRRFKKAVEGL